MSLHNPIDSLHFAESPSVDDVPGQRSQKLLDHQRAIEGSTVSYPMRLPIALAEGSGATVKDVDGNVFLDFFAGSGVLNVGHSNPYVLEAATSQLETLAQTLDFPTNPRIELIETLNEIVPNGLADNNRVVFGGPTGSDAIEASIKLCQRATGGDGLIAFRGGNHGQTAGALSLSGLNKYKRSFGSLLPNVEHCAYPDTNDDNSTSRALQEVRETIEDPYSGLTNPAGIFVEPIQGAGGVIVPPKDFLQGLREIANDNKVPLVFDECLTGIGRTGRWFASDWFDVTPDVVVLGKPLGGIGLPLSGLVYREKFDEWETGDHKGTFRGNATAMRAGTASIEYIKEHNLLEHATELGEYIRNQIRGHIDALPCLSDVRGRGLFIGIAFNPTHSSMDVSELVANIQTQAFKDGVLVLTAGRTSDVLRLMPPLVLTQKQAEVGTGILIDAIKKVCQNYSGL